ncbi:MAG TPA: alpha-L-arabinofuranosidase C-terminal domain-containing protein [Candidatus Hydrogenedentes bacterium]|nr:alpha-L-arabinofuranosidase C-terminal domain-containing protein [Candidatus Hydrogenedentota bacterium]
MPARLQQGALILLLLILPAASSAASRETRGQSNAARPPLRVVVTPDELVNEPASPLLYGHLIQSGFGRQVDGLWAEMLFNRSFEAVTPFKESVWGWLHRRPDDDLSTEDWWHSGYEETDWYIAPGNPEAHLGYSAYWDFRHGERSAHVTNRNNTSAAILAQDGLWLRKGMSYRLRGCLRHGDLMDPDTPPINITVGLYGEARTDSPLATATLRGIGSTWQQVECELPNSDYDGPATLGITVPPGITLALDGLSLMPSDNVQGWRRNAVEALKRVRPRILRWPGGSSASFYFWRDGIGPAHERRPRESTYWGGLENNDAGTAEFVALCREIGAEPLICVNVLTGSPAEAADWAAYCNAPPEHPQGALRALHGHAEPFGVTYWEIGNEPYRKYDALEYARRCVEFARTMKAADPGIQLIMAVYWRFHAFLPQMLEIAGPHIDFVADRELDESHLRGVLETLREYNARTGRSIRLCNTEWLAPGDGAPAAADSTGTALQNRAIRWGDAMDAARQLLVFQRLGGEFAFANFSNLANAWGQNVLECPKKGCYLSSTGRIFELFSAYPAAWPLRLEIDGEDPAVVAQAAWDASRERLILIALNFHGEKAELSWDLSSLGLTRSQAELITLTAASPGSFNTMDQPDAISRSVEEKKRLGERVLFSLPPHSVMMAVTK